MTSFKFYVFKNNNCFLLTCFLGYIQQLTLTVILATTLTLTMILTTLTLLTDVRVLSSYNEYLTILKLTTN